MSIMSILHTDLSIVQELIDKLCTFVQLYFGQNLCSDNTIVFPLFVLMAIVNVGIGFYYLSYPVRLYLQNRFRQLIDLARQTRDRIKQKSIYLYEQIQTYRYKKQQNKLQQFRKQVEQVIASSTDETDITSLVQVHSFAIEQAKQETLQNLKLILEQAIKLESIELAKALVENRELQQTFGSATMTTPTKTDTAISQQFLSNTDMPTDMFDVTLENLLDSAYDRIKRRFDSVSWLILCHAYGTEYTLEQYIKDRLIYYVLPSQELEQESLLITKKQENKRPL